MIKVLVKAESVLSLVSDCAPITFTEIQHRLGIHKATLSQLLKTLEQLEYVERDALRQYGIGPAIRRLAGSSAQRDLVVSIADTIVYALSQSVREVSSASMLMRGMRYLLAKSEVERTISVASGLEERSGMLFTATGLTCLAHAPEAEATDLIARHGLPEGTESPDAFAGELARIRHEGIAFCSHANDQVASVAVPVLLESSQLNLAVGISLPAFRFAGQHKRDILRELRASAGNMARLLAMNGVG